MLRRVATHGVLLGLVLAGTASLGPASAVEPSGSAVRVEPAVNASGAGGARLLQLEGAVFVGDMIVASADGLAQIRFVDNTRIVVGPNSRLRIDEFVFNPNNTAKKVTINAIRGTFRFISGNSPHQAYSIRTPTVTIGVRGTVVDFSAGPNSSSFIFQEGEGTACTTAGCVEIEDQCDLYIAPQGRAISEATGTQAQLQLARNFPFNDDQSRLAPDFRTRRNGCQVADSRFFGAPVEHTEPTFQNLPPPPPPPPPPPDDDPPPCDDCGGEYYD